MTRESMNWVIKRPTTYLGHRLGLLRRSPHLRAEMISASKLVKISVAREHIDGQIDHNYRLWMLINLELWYRHFICGEPVEELEEWVHKARVN